MTNRQMMVCAIALYADGYSLKQICKALNIDLEGLKN